MLEVEVQGKISLIKSCNKETAYKLLNALYETHPDLFKKLHAIGLSVQECQECADAILTIKKKKLNKVKAKEIFILDQWMKEGVPDDVEPATIAKVLLEVVDGSDAHLAGQPVVDFLDDVILSLCYQFFYVSCIHWHYLGIAVKSAISRK